MKKKLVALVVAWVMTFSLCACGKSEVAETTSKVQEVQEVEEEQEQIQEEEQVQETDNGEIANITAAMAGVWVDDAGDIYGFYEDGTFEGYLSASDEDVTGVYALVTDGDHIVLAINMDGKGEGEYYITLEDGGLGLVDIKSGAVAALVPYNN